MVTSFKQAKFDKFHKDNPRVFEELVKLTEQAYSAGRTKIGMRMLFEVVRWNRFIKTTDHDFKLNNNNAPYYARLIMETYPKYDGLFEVRELRS
jgi:hypothetical protein